MFETITGSKRFDGDWEVLEFARSPMHPPQQYKVEHALSLFLISELLGVNSAWRPSAARVLGLSRVIEFVISNSDDTEPPAGQIRSTWVRHAILSNRRDLVEILLREIQYLAGWWPTVSTASLALSLEVADYYIADLIIGAGASTTEAARYASSAGYSRAITRLLEDGSFDLRVLNDKGQSCMDKADIVRLLKRCIGLVVHLTPN